MNWTGTFGKFFSGLATAALAVGVIGQAPAGVAEIHPPKPVQMAANGTAVAAFTVVIEPGFHIQSNAPKLDYLIPTTLTLDAVAGVSATKVAWPAAAEHKFSFSSDQLAVFAGTIGVPVTLKAGAARGTHAMKGSFRYQACNDQLCRPPVTVPVELTVTVR